MTSDPIESITHCLLRQIGEARLLAKEREFDDAGGAIALLRENQFGGACVRAVGISIVDVVAVNEDDDVGILLERSRLAQIGQLWPVVGRASCREGVKQAGG